MDARFCAGFSGWVSILNPLKENANRRSEDSPSKGQWHLRYRPVICNEGGHPVALLRL